MPATPTKLIVTWHASERTPIKEVLHPRSTPD